MTEGLRIYDLSGISGDQIAAAAAALPRAAAMRFNALRLDPAGVTGRNADAKLRKLIAAAREQGLRVLADLASGPTGVGAKEAPREPASEDDEPPVLAAGSRRGLRGIVAAAEVAEAVRGPTRREPDARPLDPVRRLLGCGVEGFICHSPSARPSFVWRQLIREAKALTPGVVFCADTTALSDDAVIGLAGAGFDYLFNSIKSWDFASASPLEQYERHRDIAPSIGFPENLTGDRLICELLASGFAETEAEAHYRQAYAVAAVFSTGVMMPAGFECGQAQRVPDEPARFDLTSFIAGINRVKAALPALNAETAQRRLTRPGDPLVVLLRDGETAVERVLTLINTDAERPHDALVEALLGEARLDYLGDRLALTEMLPDGSERPAAARIAVAPLEVKIFRAALRPLRRIAVARPPPVARDPGHRPEWRAEARILIENVSPEIDGGRYPAKRVVGDDVVISADLLRDGHDRLAAVLRYRFEDQDWHEEPFAQIENDRWDARFQPDRAGRWHYTIEAWTDRFASWRADLEKRHEAGQDIALELAEGERLVMTAAHHAAPDDAARLREIWNAFDQDDAGQRLQVMLSDELQSLMARSDERADKVRYGRELELVVDRKEARFSAWYEMFPRSQGRVKGQSATFDDCIGRLGEVAALGFDVVYLVPIHPIGRVNRKGRDNAVIAMPGDPGSPYAIGSAEGGHRAVHPDLGTLDDFRRFVAAAAALGIDVALDFAIQCAPDHPWVKEHKRWFEWRPDGSIRYAENPPKKYEDIVNVDFYNPDRDGLWAELRDTVLFWVNQGVRIFRVDNPHTKPVPFWEWMIREVKARCPEAIFLSEAFTRPKMMRALAKAGFSQSYTYFTWRDTKPELTEYLTELALGPTADYLRPNLFTNTPDILPVFLQQGGRPAFRIRLVLAATLSPAYGIYNGFELCENRAIPGREEYIHSEKYEYKVWDWDRPGHIKRDIAILNRFRRDNPALHELTNLRFLGCPDPNIIAYAKATSDRRNIVVVAVNLDPHGLHAGEIALPLDEWEIGWDREFAVEEAFTGHSWRWRGGRQWVSLDPQHNPATLLRILPSD